MQAMRNRSWIDILVPNYISVVPVLHDYHLSRRAVAWEARLLSELGSTRDPGQPAILRRLIFILTSPPTTSPANPIGSILYPSRKASRAPASQEFWVLSGDHRHRPRTRLKTSLVQ